MGKSGTKNGQAKRPDRLTVQQRAFVGEYLRDRNATQSAIRAGYSEKTAHSQGGRLLKHGAVRAAIDAALERRNQRVEVSTDDVLRELLTFARLDLGEAYREDGTLKPIHEMPEAVRRAISSVKVEEKREGRGKARKVVGLVKEVRFVAKDRGLELLGRHLGMWRDKVELTGKDGGPVQHQQADDLGGYTDEELLQINTIHERAEARRKAAQQGGGDGGAGEAPPGT